MDDSRKLWWLRIGIGVPLVLMLAFCAVYLGVQWQVVRERHRMRLLVLEQRGACDAMVDASNPFSTKYDPLYAIPWGQAVLGEYSVSWIGLPRSMTAEERSRVRAAFPEAVIQTLPR